MLLVWFCYLCWAAKYRLLLRRLQL